MITYNFETIEQNLKNAEMKVQVTVGIDDQTGWFEIYDDETRGKEWYVTGVLTFDSKELVDYQGAFGVPECVCDCLRTHGFNTSKAEN